ncbi:MAG: zf-HC2 domain-containing protein [bacterium]|nr:zf-HC2 domain-containing protein [bacterium]
MLKCWMIRKKLLEYCYNELSGEKANKVRNHLLTCSKCQRKYEDTQNLIRVLSNKEIKKPAEGFWKEYKEDLMEKWNKVKHKKLSPEKFASVHIPNTAFNTKISLQLKLAVPMLVLVITVIITGIFVNKKELSTGQLLKEYIILEDLGENATFVLNNNNATDSLVKDIEFWEQVDSNWI